MPLSSATSSAVRVWDLPTRVFHWLLAAAVFGALISAWIGGGAMVWHMRCGLAVMALVLFRIVWGLVGGRWSRFTSFIYAQGTVLRYLRGQTRDGDHFEVGHNPLGAFSVFGLLAFLALQVATGLVADDEIATQGPLNRFVSSDKGLAATSWHRDYGQWIMLAMIALHIAAIVFYLLRKKVNLVQPMLGGDKNLPADTPASIDTAGTRVTALIVALACLALVVWISRLAG